MMATKEEDTEEVTDKGAALSELRRFQTKLDAVFIGIAALAACGGGVAQIVLLLFFKDFLNAGGECGGRDSNRSPSGSPGIGQLRPPTRPRKTDGCSPSRHPSSTARRQGTRGSTWPTSGS